MQPRKRNNHEALQQWLDNSKPKHIFSDIAKIQYYLANINNLISSSIDFTPLIFAQKIQLKLSKILDVLTNKPRQRILRRHIISALKQDQDYSNVEKTSQLPAVAYPINSTDIERFLFAKAHETSDLLTKADSIIAKLESANDKAEYLAKLHAAQYDAVVSAKEIALKEMSRNSSIESFIQRGELMNEFNKSMSRSFSTLSIPTPNQIRLSPAQKMFNPFLRSFTGYTIAWEKIGLSLETFQSLAQQYPDNELSRLLLTGEHVVKKHNHQSKRSQKKLAFIDYVISESLPLTGEIGSIALMRLLSNKILHIEPNIFDRLLKPINTTLCNACHNNKTTFFNEFLKLALISHFSAPNEPKFAWIGSARSMFSLMESHPGEGAYLNCNDGKYNLELNQAWLLAAVTLGFQIKLIEPQFPNIEDAILSGNIVKFITAVANEMRQIRKNNDSQYNGGNAPTATTQETLLLLSIGCKPIKNENGNIIFLPPTQLRASEDWRPQGKTYYAGNFFYKREISPDVLSYIPQHLKDTNINDERVTANLSMQFEDALAIINEFNLAEKKADHSNANNKSPRKKKADISNKNTLIPPKIARAFQIIAMHNNQIAHQPIQASLKVEATAHHQRRHSDPGPRVNALHPVRHGLFSHPGDSTTLREKNVSSPGFKKK